MKAKVQGEPAENQRWKGSAAGYVSTEFFEHRTSGKKSCLGHPCLVSGTSAAARKRTPGVQKAVSCHLQRGNCQGFVNQQLETANNSGCQKRHSNLFPFPWLSWPHFPVPRKGLHGCRELFGGSKFFGLDTSRASPKERLAGRVWTRRGREQGRALRLRNFESWR